MPTWFLGFMVICVVFVVVGNTSWVLMLRGWVRKDHIDGDPPIGREPKARLATERPNTIAPTIGRSSIGSGLELYDDVAVAHVRFRSGRPWVFARAEVRETRVRWAPGGSIIELVGTDGDRLALLYSAHPITATRRALANGRWLGPDGSTVRPG